MKRITIVGVGALGSHVAQFLRNEGELHLVDFDRVEAKNELSQFHGKPARGKFKVAALHNQLALLWGVLPTTNSNKLTNANAPQLICPIGETPNLVIDCLDNGEARREVQRYARYVDLPCLHGAIDAAGTFGRVGWTKNFGGNPAQNLAFEIDDEDKPDQPTCEGGENLPMLAIVSAYIARSVQRFLREGKFIGWQISPGGAVAT